MMRQFLWRVCIGVGLLAGGVAAFGEAQNAKVEYRPGVLIQLGVSDLNRSVAFYTKLGFVVTERRDDLKFVHLSTNTPGVELGLNEVPTPDVRGPILNFTVANAAAARKAMEAEGIGFVGENQVIPGKVVLATFRDPDGHRLRFAGAPPKS
jgi:catechol 2,3-dioxygenase-like lactoylglutathione lyase family enzyme